MSSEAISIQNINNNKDNEDKIKKDYLSLFLNKLVWTCAIVTVSILIMLILYILIKGIPYLNMSMFDINYTMKNASMMPAILNTLMITMVALLCAVPIGILSAVYLVEYAKRGNKIVEIIRLTTETLSGIPSIVYGLFGSLFFGVALGWGYSLLSGAFTLSIMILPLVMRTTEEALKSVPDSYREGSFALGAGKLRTVFLIILPSAIPGILSGVILSIGRIVGETAALIFTAGTVPNLVKNMMNSGRTLAVHMYVLQQEGFGIEQSYATAVVLLLLVIILNAFSSYLASKFNKGDSNGK